MAGCLFQQQITEKGNRIWVILPAAFGTGVLMLTWAVYVVSWMFSVCAGAEHFLWKYYCDVGDCAVSSWNFHPEAKKNRKNVSGIGEDDQ